jgi:hypothetical protein
LDPVSGSNMAGDAVQVNMGGAVVAARGAANNPAAVAVITSRSRLCPDHPMLPSGDTQPPTLP